MLLSIFATHSSALLNSCQFQTSHNPVLCFSYWFVSRGCTLFADFSEQWQNSFPLQWFSWPDPAWDDEPSRHLGVSLTDLEKSLCHAVGYGWPVLLREALWRRSIFLHTTPFFFLPQMLHLFMLFCTNLIFALSWCSQNLNLSESCFPKIYTVLILN